MPSFDAPLVAHGAKSLLAGTIQSNRGAIFSHRAALGLGANPGDAPVLADQFRHGRFLLDHGAFFARVVEQQLIKFRTQHLPGLGHSVAVVAVEKIKRLAGPAGRGDELHAVFFDKSRGAHFVDQAQPLQGLKSKGEQ
jgi:hypothetical protein